jgi:hypothetical protein
VPVGFVPDVTLDGASVTVDRAAGLTVSVALNAVPRREAVIAGVALDATPRVVTEKVAVVAPAATVTVAGTVAAAVFELESETMAPPGAATLDRVTVPVEGLPATTEVGERETPVNIADVSASELVTVTEAAVA